MTMDRLPLKLIDLTLAAAPIERSGTSRMARDWAGANRIVAEWAAEMPDQLLSCDFKAMFDDGFTYSGTLEFGRGRDSDIVAHVDRLMDALTSDDPSMDAWRKAVDPDGKAGAQMVLIREHYDLGTVPAASWGYGTSK